MNDRGFVEEVIENAYGAWRPDLFADITVDLILQEPFLDIPTG